MEKSPVLTVPPHTHNSSQRRLDILKRWAIPTSFGHSIDSIGYKDATVFGQKFVLYQPDFQKFGKITTKSLLRESK